MSFRMPFAVIPNERDTLALKFASLKYVPSLEFSEVADRDQTLSAQEVILQLPIEVVLPNFALEDGWLQCQ
jgi:hypothetical protein